MPERRHYNNEDNQRRSAYDILGISPDATQEDISQAFRDLASQYHPEAAGGGDEERFKDISSAYQEIKSEEKRRQYNTRMGLGAEWARAQHPQRDQNAKQNKSENVHESSTQNNKRSDAGKSSRSGSQQSSSHPKQYGGEEGFREHWRNYWRAQEKGQNNQRASSASSRQDKDQSRVKSKRYPRRERGDSSDAEMRRIEEELRIAREKVRQAEERLKQTTEDADRQRQRIRQETEATLRKIHEQSEEFTERMKRYGNIFGEFDLAGFAKDNNDMFSAAMAGKSTNEWRKSHFDRIDTQWGLTFGQEGNKIYILDKEFRKISKGYDRIEQRGNEIVGIIKRFLGLKSKEVIAHL